MLEGFWTEFFARPILEYSGYNLVNTLVYGVILLAIAFFIVYPLFNRRGVKFDYRFMLAVLPYIVFGSLLRIFEEKHSVIFLLHRSANPFEFGFYTISPGIYVLVGLITIAALIVSIFIGKKFQRDKIEIFGFIGLIPALILVLHHLINLVHFWEFAFVYAVVMAIVSALYIAFKKLNWNVVKSKLNVLVLASHTLDGTATFTALTFFKSFGEQHVVSNFFIQNFSPVSFLIIKVAIVLIILYVIDKELTETKYENLKGFMKIFIAILGFAPGIRDSFSLGLTLLT